MLKSVRAAKTIEDELWALVEEIKRARNDEAAATMLMSSLHRLFKDDRAAGADWIRFKTTIFKQFGPMRSDGSWELARDIKLEIW